tara:strand:- start:240 stop:965 length:726 start_codon:yes stop_codon:yes gene_type:complete
MKNFILILLLLLLSTKVLGEDIIIVNDIPGNGNQIKKHSKLKMHYIGRLKDGTSFDSSYQRNQPFLFQIGTRKVIEGLEMGLIGMKNGGKRTIIIPSNLAYGKNKVSDLIPRHSTLIFEIELIDVKPPSYKLIKVVDLEKKQKKGFIVIDIRSKKEIKKTGTIPGSISITAFDKNGKFERDFFNNYYSKVTLLDHVIFVSRTGDISSILANGFVEELGLRNIYSLEGGIEAYFDKKIVKHH